MCKFISSYDSIITIGSLLQHSLKAIVKKEQMLTGRSSQRAAQSRILYAKINIS